MVSERLVEEAAKAIFAATGGHLDSEENGIDAARAAFAVFEKAHAPTDDERKVLDRAVRGVTWNALSDLRYDDDGLHVYWADPVEGCWVAFRRVDCVGEEELPKRRLPTGVMVGPQGEPTDVIAVQNVARIIAAAASDWNHNDCGDDDHHLGHSNWGAYIDDARAALRATAEAKGEGR